MRLQSIAHALPELSVDQATAWQILSGSPEVAALRPRSQEILRKVLTNDHGIETRHFAVRDFDRLFSRDAGELNQCFEAEAPKLASEALVVALEKAGVLPSELDALFICTCSGYLCPGVSSHVAEQLGIRSDAYLADFVGLGCGAAIPTLRGVSGFLSENPDAVVAMVAVEICSAAFFLDNDPGVLISLCLFGDGASASIWRGGTVRSGEWSLLGWDTEHDPSKRELLRFVNEEGKLKNKLHRLVPETVAQLADRLRARAVAGLGAGPLPEVVSHGGGRNVLDSLRGSFPDQEFLIAADVLRRCGNMSSPSVLVAFEQFLQTPGGESAWLLSFGAGFSAHGVFARREE